MTNREFIKLLIKERVRSAEEIQRLEELHNGDSFAVLEHLLEEDKSLKHTLGKLWGNSLNVAYVDLSRTIFQSQVVEKLPEKYARKMYMIPLYRFGDSITVAMADPINPKFIQNASKIMKAPVSPVFSFSKDILDAIDMQYQSGISLEKYASQVAQIPGIQMVESMNVDQLKLLALDEDVAKYTHALLLLAIKERASDIHIENQRDYARVRFRIDGVLHEKYTMELPLMYPLSLRLKNLAKLDVTQRLRPQEGRIHLELSNRTIDFSFSSIPMLYGEKIVLRVLNPIQTHEIQDLEELGFSKSILEGMKAIIGKPGGIFFVTGPSGSGKTTTLFSLLKYLNTPEKNIMTVEETIEYRLDGINQAQVNQSNFSYTDALTLFQKQDPDVILVGQIDTPETARMAIQCALSGQLILTSMHTNNSMQLLTRLIEFGIEPYLISPALTGVLSQRLVRRICDYCRTREVLTPEQMDTYFVNTDGIQVAFHKGTGCRECNGTGYSGRLTIHELFLVNREIRSLISHGKSIFEIEKAARKYGFTDMRYDAMKKVLRGLITIDELERVTLPAIL